MLRVRAEHDAARIAEADQPMLLDVDAVSVPLTDGSGTELALLRWWVGGRRRGASATAGAPRWAGRAPTGAERPPRPVGGRAPRPGAPQPPDRHGSSPPHPLDRVGVADADPRHAVAEIQERTACRTPAARVDEDISQRPIDASRGSSVGCSPWSARTSPTSGSARHARLDGRVTTGFAELLHQHGERGGRGARPRRPATTRRRLVLRVTVRRARRGTLRRGASRSGPGRGGWSPSSIRGRRRTVGECTRSSSRPSPRYMWTPHGRHGSKLRTVRMMSIPLKLSGAVLLEDRRVLHRVLVGTRRAVDVARARVPRRRRVRVVVRDLARRG